MEFVGSHVDDNATEERRHSSIVLGDMENICWHSQWEEASYTCGRLEASQNCGPIAGTLRSI